MPTSVISFLEGTRFTPAKHDAQNSPFRHLLKPKVGGLAVALATLGEQFDALLDVTIVFPDGPPTFWDLMTGRVARVVVDVRKRAIPADLVGGDYVGDPQMRSRMQAWVNSLWLEKDALIDSAQLAAASEPS